MRPAAGLRFRGSNHGGVEIFRAPLDRLLYKERRSFPRVKRPGHDVDLPFPSSAGFVNGKEIYLRLPVQLR